MKKIITVLIFSVVVVFIYINRSNIQSKLSYFYLKYLVPDIRQNLSDNEYRKKTDYEYVKINENYKVENKNDIKNAIYTYLDAGWDEYKIKCSVDYATCVDDVNLMVKNNTYLTDLSNFVHPFNTFDKINTSISNTGIITLNKEPRYSKEQIKKINKKVNEIYKDNYDPNKNVRENIKIFHDYIINNTKYDTNNKTGKSDVSSSTAYGVLFDNVGICSGYTDAMQLFLEKMKVKSYRISSQTHEWNLVYVEGKWLNLDLTWDDPIVSDGSDRLSYDYFLITTDELKNKNDNEHGFDNNIYIEAK